MGARKASERSSTARKNTRIGTHISGGCCALLMSAICTTSRNAPSTLTASFALVSMYEIGWAQSKEQRNPNTCEGAGRTRGGGQHDVNISQPRSTKVPVNLQERRETKNMHTLGVSL